MKVNKNKTKTKIRLNINIKPLLLSMSLFLIPTLTVDSFGDIEFQEISEIVGISYTGQSWGSSWADYNNDGFPDLWTSNHFNTPSLFVNNGNGSFFLYTDTAIDDLKGKDLHGSSWADFDNDGDKDLIILAGGGSGYGQESNIFLINNNGKLEDFASKYQLDYPLGRGRTPLWFDWNNDGLLDVFLANGIRPDKKAGTTILEQNGTKFIEIASDQIKNYGSVSSAQISDLSNNNKIELVISSPTLGRIYEFRDSSIYDLTDSLKLSPKLSKDLTIGDFNGDLLQDLFLVTTKDQSIVIQDDLNILKAQLLMPEDGFNFTTKGNVTFNIFPYAKNFEIFLGSKKINQTNFSIDPSNQQYWGTKKIDSPEFPTLLINYLSNDHEWNISFLSPIAERTNIIIKSENIIEEYSDSDFGPYIFDELLINTKNGFLKKSLEKSEETSCRSVVSGDFDNDMDLDLYLTCSLSVKNLPNILYENLGNATFSKIPNAGGAVGSELGVGESVSIVDYNNDGFLDLFITNGLGLEPFSNNGPYQLFRNIGNENHWLQIDLVGTKSNRDAVGSKVFLSAGNLTQVRENNGNMHFKSQNHNRVHFGLGNFSMADNVVVYFPSGMITQLENIGADQILKIFEPTSFLPPKTQSKLGVEFEDVFCNEQLIKIQKINGNVACVKSSTFEKLKERGWAMIVQ